jgi:hypothetical protein
VEQPVYDRIELKHLPPTSAIRAFIDAIIEQSLSDKRRPHGLGTFGV